MHAPIPPDLAEAFQVWNTFSPAHLFTRMDALARGDYSEGNKLTRLEWKTLKIFAQNKEHMDERFNVCHQFVNLMQPRTFSDYGISVCVQNYKKELRAKIAQATSVIEKIILFVLAFFIKKYTHIYFSKFENGINTSHGKRSEYGLYKTVTDGISPSYFDEFDISINALMPQFLPEDKREEFKTTFFTLLSNLLDQAGRPVTPLSVWGYLKIILPSFGSVNPSDVRLSNPEIRPMSCGQYIVEAIIEAHRTACRQFNENILDDMSYYGLPHTAHPDSLHPADLVTAFVARGIFVQKPKFYI